MLSLKYMFLPLFTGLIVIDDGSLCLPGWWAKCKCRVYRLGCREFFFFSFLLGRSPLSFLSLSLGGCIAGKVSGGKWERTGEGNGTKQDCGGSFEGGYVGGGGGGGL